MKTTLKFCGNERENGKKSTVALHEPLSGTAHGRNAECVRSRLPGSGNHPTRAQQAKAKRSPPHERNRSDLLPFPRLLSAAKSTATSLPVSPIQSDPIQTPMDFFKSILAEPDPDPASPPLEQEPESGSASPAPAGGGGGWGFGGLLKTLTSQSETVLETYRRDLAEFGTGLRRETEVLREAAARAARDLPSSAHALDGLADIVAQGKDALSQVAAAAAAPVSAHSDGVESEQSSAAGAQVRYSRFEAQLRALQADPATFTADPEDAEDFAAWSEGFSLDERKDEIEALCYDSDALEAMVDRLVPDTVESEVFWARYFYRVHKLKQQEDARAKLVQRVIAEEEDEDLSWEVDDEDEEEQQKEDAKEPVARQQEATKEVQHEVEAKENERVLEESAALEGEQTNADEPQPVVFR